MASTLTHLVVPGQIIAEGDDFLRGHGTYVEATPTSSSSPEDDITLNDDDTKKSRERLVASVAGRVERVNKLVSVIPVSSSFYHGHVGDLIIGRIVSVANTRWRVCIGSGSSSRLAQLPLSGVHLPGGVQRVRTQQDSREMRQLFTEGDLVCAEVHNIGSSDGSLSLHTRSLSRYGKLENGCLIIVPPSLIARRKNHFCSMADHQISLLLGTNGYIWIQRALPHEQQQNKDNSNDDSNNNEKTSLLLAEHQEKLNKQHKETPVLPDERLCIARVRNSIACLSKVHLMVKPENIELVYKQSQKTFANDVAAMLHPDNIILLTRPLMK